MKTARLRLNPRNVNGFWSQGRAVVREIANLDLGMYVIYMFSCMAQLNINLNPEFDQNLKLYMKERKISAKSEAIRQAFRELAEQLKKKKSKTDFRLWRGIALSSPSNPKPRFKNEDELWG